MNKLACFKSRVYPEVIKHASLRETHTHTMLKGSINTSSGGEGGERDINFCLQFFPQDQLKAVNCDGY